MSVQNSLHILKSEISDQKPKLGSYYIRKYKSGWSLYHQYFRDGKKLFNAVEVLAYKDLGFRVDMTLDEARERCSRLNRENNLDKQSIRKAAAALVGIENLDSILFPPEYLSEFEARLKNENQGSEEHLRKLYSHFRFIQEMCRDLRIFPHQYKDSEKLIYNYFVKRRVSVNYSQRLISLMNRYGKFICRKEGKYFEEIIQARGISRTRIQDATEDKRGVRKESKPIGPTFLEKKKAKLSELNYNWLFISIWFGLRPSDFTNLDKSTLQTNSEGQEFISVYQSKLTSLPKPKRYKYIPLLFDEQKKAWAFIKSKNYKAPIYKTMRNIFGEGYGLYAGRKNFIDMMLGFGYKLEDISLWMGHTSIERSWQNYKEKNAVNLPTPKKSK